MMIFMTFGIDYESFSCAIVVYKYYYTYCRKTQYHIKCVLLILFIITVTETFISQLSVPHFAQFYELYRVGVLIEKHANESIALL